MDLALGWTIASVVLATSIGVFQIVAHYRSHPRQRIEYTVSSRKLASSDLPNEDVEVSISGAEVPDPYYTEVQLHSNSRRDIRSDQFDSRAPLVIRVEPGGAHMLRTSHSPELAFRITETSGQEWQWAQFDMGPQLIKKRSSCRLTFISSGKPEVRLQSPLADVDVTPVAATETFNLVRDSILGGLWAFLVGMFVTAWLIGEFGPDDVDAFFYLVVWFVGSAAIGALTALLLYLIKSRRRVRPL